MNMNSPITLAQQAVDTANAIHPSNCARAQEYLLSILPAAAVDRAGYTVHILDDGSAVAIGNGWHQADAAYKVSAADYAATRVIDDHQSAIAYGDFCIVAAMGAGGVATAYGCQSTAITYCGRAATGVDGRAVSLTAQGLLRGEAGSILTWLLDTCAESVTLKVGRGEAGVAGKWYRLGDDGKPCLVCK